jgi:hypothetical protein
VLLDMRMRMKTRDSGTRREHRLSSSFHRVSPGKWVGLFMLLRAASFATGCGSKPPDGTNGGNCHESCTGRGCDQGLTCNGSSNECEPDLSSTYPTQQPPPSCTYYTSSGCDAGEIAVECSEGKTPSNSFTCSELATVGYNGGIYCCNLKPDCILLQCDTENDASTDATADANDE